MLFALDANCRNWRVDIELALFVIILKLRIEVVEINWLMNDLLIDDGQELKWNSKLNVINLTCDMKTIFVWMQQMVWLKCGSNV